MIQEQYVQWFLNFRDYRKRYISLSHFYGTHRFVYENVGDSVALIFQVTMNLKRVKTFKFIISPPIFYIH